MATGGGYQPLTFTDPRDENEYFGRVYKAIINLFSSTMPAVQLKDAIPISRLLTEEDMQKVQKKYDNEGNNCAARKLLELMRMKHGWYNAFMEALDLDYLKMHEHKRKFMHVRAEVDKAWLHDHPRGHSQSPHAPVLNPSVNSNLKAPTQTSHEGACSMAVDMISGRSHGSIASDFVLPTPASTGFQMDSVLEGETDPDKDIDTTETYPTGRPKSTGQLAPKVGPETAVKPDLLQQSKSHPATTSTADVVKNDSRQCQATQPTDAPDIEEQYTDAISRLSVDEEAVYQQLEKAGEDTCENDYTQLTVLCLERDASPTAAQVTEVPEQEVGEEAQPEVLSPQAVQRRRRPQTRQEHPSLSQAISADPHKDFEFDFVNEQLSSLPGWSPRQEEHKVIHLVKPNRNTEGYYVLWYWNLAKRPTICVAHGGRVITFVVHKSTAAPTRFYINRRQRKTSSLRALLQHHQQHGIQYTPQAGEEITVWLSNPYCRQ